ncbi:MAG TPA: hypothetical protein VFN57_15540 [Thermomicrobiaceae bacterium]|nr:hypothetical protein [Thermomicrobiaceae bacterium]
MDATRGVGDVVTAFVAELTGRPLAELPDPSASGDEWPAVLGQWPARPDCGLVVIAEPEPPRRASTSTRRWGGSSRSGRCARWAGAGASRAGTGSA